MMSEKKVEITTPKVYRVDLYGYDQYGTFQYESLIVADKPMTSKLAYAYLGLYLPEDYITKIPEWLFK